MWCNAGCKSKRVWIFTIICVTKIIARKENRHTHTHNTVYKYRTFAYVQDRCNSLQAFSTNRFFFGLDFFSLVWYRFAFISRRKRFFCSLSSFIYFGVVILCWRLYRYYLSKCFEDTLGLMCCAHFDLLLLWIHFVLFSSSFSVSLHDIILLSCTATSFFQLYGEVFKHPNTKECFSIELINFTMGINIIRHTWYCVFYNCSILFERKNPDFVIFFRIPWNATVPDIFFSQSKYLFFSIFLSLVYFWFGLMHNTLDRETNGSRKKKNLST